ncbi:MAG: hypothetical protein R2909_21675 [Gemmatimonadales bacterium]
MRRIVQALLLVPPLLLPIRPRDAAAQAKVDEQIVAPNEDGLTYYVSPRGAHLVAVTQKGSRYVVSHDGVPGPQVDQVLNPGTASWIMNFSPDGQRHGYTAKVGQDWIAVVDGKEVYRQPIGSNDLINRGGGPHLRFSPNGKHWVFYYHNPDARLPTADPSWYMWDGVAGPKGAEAVLVVSPDGERHAYVVANPANPNQKALIVDGKPAGYVGFDPIFSADGTRLYTTREIRPAQGPVVTEVLIDGRVAARALTAKIHIPPAGPGALILLARQDPQTQMQRWAIAAANGIVPNSESSQFGEVWFSDDGKHYAIKAVQSSGAAVLIVDGIRHREYASVDSVRFTDTGTVSYVARTGAKWFVVTGDQESEVMLSSMFVGLTTGKGGRIGYAASTTSGPVVVVDGKATKVEGRLATAEAFSFSPDGTRAAWWLGSSGSPGGTVSVDGAAGAGILHRDFAQLTPGDPVRYIWNPDSKFTLHYGAAGAQWGNDFGFYLGDRYYTLGNVSRVVKPTFTPDGKHLFWSVEEGQRGMMTVWLDGKQVYEFDEQGRAPLAAPGGWQMGADGVLTFVVQTVDGFKRVRITPGPEHGVEAMLAKAKVVSRS